MSTAWLACNANAHKLMQMQFNFEVVLLLAQIIVHILYSNRTELGDVSFALLSTRLLTGVAQLTQPK